MPNERNAAIRALTTEWMRKAKADLRLAQMVEDDRISPEILAFHA